MSIKTIILAPVFSLVALTACAGSYSNESYGSDDSYGSKTKTTQVASATVAKKTVTKVETSVGTVFANGDGKTLYTFTKDDAAKSNCYGGCAASWPPFAAKENAKEWDEFTVIERTDGTYQWAYQSAPLYLWVGDQNKGDTNGHGIKNVWYVASAK